MPACQREEGKRTRKASTGMQTGGASLALLFTPFGTFPRLRSAVHFELKHAPKVTLTGKQAGPQGGRLVERTRVNDLGKVPTTRK